MYDDFLLEVAIRIGMLAIAVVIFSRTRWWESLAMVLGSILLLLLMTVGMSDMVVDLIAGPEGNFTRYIESYQTLGFAGRSIWAIGLIALLLGRIKAFNQNTDQAHG